MVRMLVSFVQKPSISLTSPSGGLVWGPEGSEITRGYSFVFTCLMNFSSTPGSFILIFSGSNITHIKTAVNNSPSFSFPAAEYGHQGNYSWDPTVRPLNHSESFLWLRVESECCQPLLNQLGVLLCTPDPANSVLANIGLHFYNKVTTRQNSKQKENTEMLVFRAEGATDEEEQAGGTKKDVRRFHHFSQT
ncbi:uncharacterized protein LOC113021389 isoform X2 [Astatotilapia calliptera]|uniref:uncharacterized protein LOC113021389 isoform X2 n=1 Tax=Astatotilapia calliptera TaxID=8154 RepID=UPI000E426B51|nr:uncharacterized protein LOC113021389 isoform X2 [Astatotilapia calliptera]